MQDGFDIIDAHVHLYRGLSLEKKNVLHPGRRDRDRWGNPENITKFMDLQGVSKVVALPNYPTLQMRASMRKEADTELGADADEAKRKQAYEAIEEKLIDRLKRQNEWMCGLAAENPRIVPAMSMQKLFSSDEMVAELELRHAQGSRIVKMLPGMYHEYPNDRAFWLLFDRCQELEVAVISDTGTLGLKETGIAYGEPINFTEVLEAFPRLHVVMAHFPSAFWDQRVELAQRFPNLFFDTSGSFHAEHMEVRDGSRAADIDDAVRVMRKVGIDRFMFGSDGPRFLFQPEAEQILSLDLTDGEKAMILAENAKRIYRIS